MMSKVLGKRNYLFMRQSSSRYEAHGKLRVRKMLESQGIFQ